VKIYTRRGDEGETNLLYGARVTKSDIRCEAYGTIDEAASALGLARNSCHPEVNDIVFTLQQDLFDLGYRIGEDGISNAVKVCIYKLVQIIRVRRKIQ